MAVDTGPKQSDDGVVYHRDMHHSDLMKGFPPPKGKRVTLDNWCDTTETIRWTNNNGPRVFKSVPIETGDAPVWALPRRMMDPEKLNRAEVLWGETVTKAKRIPIPEWLRRSETDGFIVLHDGHIVAEYYLGETTPTTRRHLWSGGKGFLATILARFLFDGTIDEQGRVTDYIPELSGTGFAGATVRHLLDQTTGVKTFFPSSEWVKRQPPAIQREWEWGTPEMRRADHELAREARSLGLFAKLPHESTNSGCYDYLLTVKSDHEHGAYFNYTVAPNCGALQWILERTTGTSFFEHVARLWRQLGVESIATMMVDGAGSGSVVMDCTLRDWARWGQMLCNRGRAGSGQVIPGVADLVDDVLKNPGPERWTEKTALKPGFLQGSGYRSHVFTLPTLSGSDPILLSPGAYHQNCLVDLKRRNVVVQVASFWDMAPDKIQNNDLAVNNYVAFQSFMDGVLPELVSG